MTRSLRARSRPTRSAGRVRGGLAGVLAALSVGCAARRPAGPPAPGGSGAGSTTGASAAGARVPPEEIAAFRGTRVEDLIQGRIAGVQVTRTGDGDYAIRIRGAQTVLGDGTPLYVIDGVQVRAPGLLSALAGVQPQSVARIQVLKNAGDTAIYGVLGGNGVIVITTKRGRP